MLKIHHFWWMLVRCNKKSLKYLSGKITSWFWLEDHKEGRWFTFFSKTIVIETGLAALILVCCRSLNVQIFWCRAWILLLKSQKIKYVLWCCCKKKKPKTNQFETMEDVSIRTKINTENCNSLVFNYTLALDRSSFYDWLQIGRLCSQVL